jgi:hypothetical protein
MKIAGLITGIVLMLLSGFVFLICLALPSMTRKIDFEESLAGLIPSALLFMLALALTAISGIFVLKGRNTGGNGSLADVPVE